MSIYEESISLSKWYVYSINTDNHLSYWKWNTIKISTLKFQRKKKIRNNGIASLKKYFYNLQRIIKYLNAYLFVKLMQLQIWWCIFRLSSSFEMLENVCSIFLHRMNHHRATIHVSSIISFDLSIKLLKITISV